MKSFNVEMPTGDVLSYDSKLGILHAWLGIFRGGSVSPDRMLDRMLAKAKELHDVFVVRTGGIMVDMITRKTPGPTADPTLPYDGVVELHCQAIRL